MYGTVAWTDQTSQPQTGIVETEVAGEGICVVRSVAE